MTISVVMATFNGVKYLLDQMDSIKRQTRQPDEVLIFDDRSADQTQEMIRQYILDNNLAKANWKLAINGENYGYKYNFMQGIEKATGDIIFLSDQDDVWYADKIEKMAAILENDARIGFLASNFKVRYDSGAGSKILIKQNNNYELEKVEFNEKVIYVNRPGCTYCFKKELFNDARKYWQPSLAHDQLLWYYAATRDELFIYNRQMIEFRRHDNNSSGNYYKQRRQSIKYINEQKKNIAILFSMANDNKVNSQKMMVLNQAKKFCEARSNLYSSRNIKYYIELVIFYHKFYYTMSSMLGDFLLGMISTNERKYR